GVEQAQARMREADAEVRREELLRVELPDPGLPAGRVVLDAEDPVAGRIHLAGPARVRLAGPNGSGKTTLLRRLVGGDSARVPWAFLPRTYVSSILAGRSSTLYVRCALRRRRSRPTPTRRGCCSSATPGSAGSATCP